MITALAVLKTELAPLKEENKIEIWQMRYIYTSAVMFMQLKTTTFLSVTSQLAPTNMKKVICCQAEFGKTLQTFGLNAPVVIRVKVKKM